MLVHQRLVHQPGCRPRPAGCPDRSLRPNRRGGKCGGAALLGRAAWSRTLVSGHWAALRSRLPFLTISVHHSHARPPSARCRHSEPRYRAFSCAYQFTPLLRGKERPGSGSGKDSRLSLTATRESPWGETQSAKRGEVPGTYQLPAEEEEGEAEPEAVGPCGDVASLVAEVPALPHDVDAGAAHAGIAHQAAARAAGQPAGSDGDHSEPETSSGRHDVDEASRSSAYGASARWLKAVSTCRLRP